MQSVLCATGWRRITIGSSAFMTMLKDLSLGFQVCCSATSRDTAAESSSVASRWVRPAAVPSCRGGLGAGAGLVVTAVAPSRNRRLNLLSLSRSTTS